MIENADQVTDTEVIDQRQLDQQYDEKVRKVFINVLEYVGEQCVIEARENGNYKDQTGNLRSSISYAIVEDGKIIKHGLLRSTSKARRARTLQRST